MDEYKYRALNAEAELELTKERMKLQKGFFFALVGILLLVILYSNNHAIVLRIAGLNETQILYSSQMTYGEIRVIFSDRDDGNFAMLRKNRFGIWSVMRTANRDSETGFLYFTWSSIGWHGRDFINGWHSALYGTNAIARIGIDNTLLPPNTSISVRQEGRRYVVHIISTGNTELHNPWRIQYLIADFIEN